MGNCSSNVGISHKSFGGRKAKLYNIERVIPKEKELENDFSNDEEIINGIEDVDVLL